MEDYKPNSHKSKEEPRTAPEKKKVEKVVKGVVKTRKKNEIRKLADIFISEDISNVKSYIFMDVLIPAIKKAISDIVTDGIDMILYGGNGRRKRSSSVSNVSYRSYYDKKDNYRREEPQRRARFNYDDIVLESRGEAEEVLARMGELIETYGMVTVADLYDLVGKTCDYTADKYGWLNIRNAEPERTRDGGYVLRLPKAIPID